MSNNDTNQQPSPSDRQLDEILAELMRAVDAGQSVAPDEWLQRYPDFAADLSEFFDKKERLERLVRPLRKIAAEALNVRCPHCHNSIELLEDAIKDVSCPSCGSSFSLVGEKNISHYAPGEKTVGHFELLDRVGIGAFGTVWKARDTQLDRTVAVKIPRSSKLDELQTELFLRDARAAAQLKHPNIVGVHEVGKQDDTIYIVSDFIEGANLKEWMDAKRLTPREAAELCIKIAMALDHAHGSDVIHRDLKPANVMMDSNGQPHIVDFGLAKRESGEITITVEGQILGTPAYMPPEQARGEGHTVDRRGDIYSLGVILFELLTGELPFRGDKQMLIVQILRNDPPSPRRLNSTIPRDLETICLKCLEKEPHKRYQSSALLLDELNRFLSDLPIKSRPINSATRTWRWCKRRPAIAALIGVCVLAALSLITTLGVSNIMISEQKSQTDDAYDELAVLHGELEVQQKQTANALSEARASKSLIEIEQGKTKTALSAAETANAQLRKLLAKARVDSYADRLRLAEREWVGGNTSRAKYLLGTCDEELRGWEWRYVKNLVTSGRASIVLDAGQQYVFSVTFSPDGKRVASGSTNYWNEKDNKSEPGRVIVWDVLTGEAVHDFVVDMHVCSVDFSHDGKRLLAAGFGGKSDLLTPKATVWNLNAEAIEFTLPSTSEPGVFAAIFSPDGKRIVTGGVKNAQVWNLATGQQERQFPSEAVHRLRFSSDGQLLAVAGRGIKKDGPGSVRFWNFVTGEEVEMLKPNSPLRWIHGLAFSSNGKLFATSGGYQYRRRSQQPERIRLWDKQTGLELLAIDGRTSDLYCVDFSPNGTRVISAGGEWNATMNQDRRFGEPRTPATPDILSNQPEDLPADVTLWDVTTGQELFFLRGHVGSVFSVAFSPDGAHIASGGGDQKVRIWSIEALGDGS